MNVILSIKPRYINAILNGAKKFEFRRAIFRNRKISRVYVYSTRPVSKIVASFEISKIVEDHPKNLWYELSEYSGLREDEFFRYFDGCDKGFAIAIDNVEEFDPPLDPAELIPGFAPPQSFRYLPEAPSSCRLRYADG